MRIAVAGSGAMARYICEEFPKYGHQVVVLSRTEKAAFKGNLHVSQVVTDYSVTSITEAIKDCDMLTSMILSYGPDFIDVHLKLIEACQASPKCKRFIPSEYGGDLENHPDLPVFYYRTREPIRKVLREQTELEWTLVSVGWFMDYVVPSKNRYLQDPGPAFPVDLTANRIIIPGTGNDPIDVTAARDVAAALAMLADAPKWETYTYVSGVQTSWNNLATLVQKHYPQVDQVKHLGLGQILDTIQTSEDEVEILVSHYQMFTPLGAGSFSPDLVQRDRRKFFAGFRFRTPEQLVNEALRSPGSIV
ncbi:uncharacterized protein PV06_08184 [Exophiala oligosperma]|uniref:NmrA-like domain-containing protein n=1 Tax=Exophiala oligosperma TaxID=215243 RepID=A0A0D2D903_9EURO|nr:uncharacterized protein PV06_08184 [Exophiala oligosperma]KIW39583.1 hypothetical protein PV06_08184 [Exophiala oligosperma]